MNQTDAPGTRWHVPPDQLDAFGDGSLGPVEATSVEAHLLACDRCRRTLADRTGASRAVAARQDDVWARIADEVDRPHRVGRLESTWLTVTVGTPALIAAAVAAVVVVLVVPLVADAGSARAGVATFLALAPLVPMIGVWAAFRPGADPAGELTLAAPLATMRLVLVRSLVVSLGALPLGALAAAILPARIGLLMGWVLPGLAFSGLALVLAQRMPVERAIVGLVAAWALLVGPLAADLRRGSVTAALDHWVVNQPATQAAFAAVAIATFALAVARRDDVVTTWSEP